MSLDISLYNENEEEIMDMNWLRNPYGLCNWAEDNTAETNYNPDKEHSLWYVINNWSYDNSSNVDRGLFLDVVIEYWEIIKNLKQGYYFFNLPGYRQFVEANIHLMPQEKEPWGASYIKGEKYAQDRRLMIPMENFKHPEFNLGNPCLKKNQKWFAELVEFANMLQDEQYTFYCSN